MDFDWPLIITGFIFSGVGFVYFSYGRKQVNVPIAICGVALMGYPYVAPTVIWSIVIGGVLSALPFVFRWW
jgi:hypothetical protein